MGNLVDYKEIYEREHQESSGYKINNWGLCAAKFWSCFFEFSSVIEVGCGNGKLLDALVAMNKVCTGVDVVEGIYKRQGYSYFSRDISKDKLPFADKHFDLGISFDVFEHLADADFAIRELLRVSKAQIIAVPHSKSFSEKARYELHLIVKPADWWLKKLVSISGSSDWISIGLRRYENGIWREVPANQARHRTLYLHGVKDR